MTVEKSAFHPNKNTASKKINLKAPAKINLYLNVLKKRTDGYHDICSVVQKISLCDLISIKVNETGRVKLNCDNKALENRDNIAVKAALLMKKEFGIKKGLDIRLKKNIPVGSGLGGGSSDAAAVLRGIKYLFNLKVGEKEFFYLGEKLGADVNFFLSDFNAGIIYGKGEKVTGLDANAKLKFLLIFTGEQISTAEIYKAVKPRLTKYIDGAKLISLSIRNNYTDLLGKVLYNSLTPAYLKHSKRGAGVWEALSKIEDGKFFLSGSGSTIVALLDMSKVKTEIDAALCRKGIKSLEVGNYEQKGG